MKNFFSKNKFITLLSAIVLSVGFLSVYQNVFASITISSPSEGSVGASTWAPSVSWSDTGDDCQYSYGSEFTPIDCANDGADIPPPPDYGMYTLSISTNSGAYTSSVTFDYFDDTPVPGCTDPEATNYNPSATEDDGSCDYNFEVQGCTDPGAVNFNPEANSDDGSCYYNPGCTDPEAENYNDQADHDDGSCTYPVSGCMDDTAFNFNPDAVSDDGSCYYNPGCTDPAALNYDNTADFYNETCEYPPVNTGCTDSSAINYDGSANEDDGSCLYFSIQSPLGGEFYNSSTWSPAVTWPSNASTCEFNYDGAGWSSLDCSLAGGDISAPNSSGTFTLNLSVNSGAYELSSTFDFTRMTVGGCTDPSAINYDVTAEEDNGSCYYNPGCTDPAASNYDNTADYEDGSCSYTVSGCTDSSAINYSPDAVEDDGTCLYFSIQSPLGGEFYNSSTWSPAVTWPSNASTCEFNYDGAGWSSLDCSLAGGDISAPNSSGSYTLYLTVDSGLYAISSNFEFARQGCTDDTAFNFDSNATEDDGSCYYNPGCTDSEAANYNTNANQDDGSCYYNPGCTDSEATNYNSNADHDDGSCEYDNNQVPGCTDASATNYNASANTDDGSCEYNNNQVPGCTDASATNYDPSATTDDGSCTFPPSGSGGGSSSPTQPSITVAAGSRTGGGSSVSSSLGITGPTANTAISQIQSNNANIISPVFINLLQNRNKVLAINNANNNSNSNGTNVTSPLAGIIGVINSDFQFSISVAPSNSITGNNQVNSNNEENLNLQRFLNSQGFIVNTNPDRPGSPGNETNVFGSLTRNALANFQRFVGIEPADGRFTPITRSFINGFLKSLEMSQ